MGMFLTLGMPAGDDNLLSTATVCRLDKSGSIPAFAPGYCDVLLLGLGELHDAWCVHIALHLKDSRQRARQNTGRSVRSQSCPGLSFWYPFDSSPLISTHAILSGGPDMKLIQPRHALQMRNERQTCGKGGVVWQAGCLWGNVPICANMCQYVPHGQTSWSNAFAFTDFLMPTKLLLYAMPP